MDKELKWMKSFNFIFKNPLICKRYDYSIVWFANYLALQWSDKHIFNKYNYMIYHSFLTCMNSRCSSSSSSNTEILLYSSSNCSSNNSNRRPLSVKSLKIIKASDIFTVISMRKWAWILMYLYWCWRLHTLKTADVEDYRCCKLHTL